MKILQLILVVVWFIIYLFYIQTIELFLKLLVGSSNPSTTTSRKNSLSSTLKCDNITKHPNKKQIEDKLNQIHDEYLKVTNSLMESIKKVDNQVNNIIRQLLQNYFQKFFI